MDHCFSQSTPSNYFTSKSRSRTLQKSCSSKCSTSTLTRPYNLEESLKQYENLLKQNHLLKNMLFHQNPHNNHSNFTNLDPHQVNSNNPKLFNPKMSRNQSSKCLNSTGCNNQSSYQASYQGSQSYQNSYKENDMGMWSIKHRNKFLQQKLQNVQSQYFRQQNTINSVMNSQKWQNRFDCKESTCYQDKYIKLLRVKSPVLLD